MFSLPPIFPHDPHPLYYPSLTTHSSHHHHAHPNTQTATDNRLPTHPHTQQPPTQQILQHHHNHHHNNANTTTPHQPPLRTTLSILAADENILAYRKRALARYGAQWLRPPGVAKTLQGRDDERAEREEVEAQREREARAEEEMMRAEELAMQQQEQGQEQEQGVGEGEGEGEGGVDLDAEVPDAEGGEGWSDDDDDEEEEEDEEDVISEEEEGSGTRVSVGMGMGMGMGMPGAGMFDGPSTPLNDDRTPQRFRLNPFQAPTAEGDGDYGSPLAARHSQRAAAARGRDVSPGVMAAMGRGVGAGAGPGGGSQTGVIDMEADLDDAIPMEETMMEEGSYEHTDSELEDLSSEDDGGVGASAGLGSRSVFGGGAIGAAVRRISGQDRRASEQRRVSGDRRVNSGRRVSGRGRGHGGREN